MSSTGPSEQVIEKEVVFKDQMMQIYKMAKNKRMLMLMPQIFWTGISIAVYSSLFSVMINDSVKIDPTKSEEQNNQN